MNDEPKVEDEKEPATPKWERRSFAINDSMRQVTKAAITATQAEIASLKRKLAKIQYGS